MSKYGGSCSTQGPWAIQYLPKSLGSFSVANIVIASQVGRKGNLRTIGRVEGTCNDVAVRRKPAGFATLAGHRPHVVCVTECDAILR